MKNIAIKLGIILLTLVWACDSERRNRLSPEEMSAVIADLKLLEAKVDHFYLRNPDSSKVAFLYLQNEVFQKHGIDSAVYYASYEHYLSRKKQLIKILEAASNQLTVEEENLVQKKTQIE